MATPPRVSVLMSAYNAERYVAEAVESVLSQTYADFEFLVFEDGSDDATLSVLRRYSDPRIRLIENAANRGLTANLISGMHLARGEYVARFDADDICLADRLRQQVYFLDSNPGVGIVGSAVTFFGEGVSDFVGYQPTDHESIKCMLLFGYTMLHPSVMLRRAEFERYQLAYDPEFVVSQDHDLWVRAIQHVRFANLAVPLVRMREHGGKIGRTNVGRQRECSDRIRLRQLVGLGIDAGQRDAEILGRLDCDNGIWSPEDLQHCEELLLEIFSANERSGTFDQSVLVRMGAARYRGLCRAQLMLGSAIGRSYWRSRVRRLDRSSVRELFGMVYRSSVGLWVARARARIWRSISVGSASH